MAPDNDAADTNAPGVQPIPEYRDDGGRRPVVLAVIAAVLAVALIGLFLATAGDDETAVDSTALPAPSSTDLPPTTARPTTTASTTTAPPTSTSTSTTVAASTTTTIDPYTVPHQMPFAADQSVSYATDEHHDYPAADIFAASGCGAPVVSPVNGVVDGFEAATTYTREADDPAGRGGNWVSIMGDDGVRYYMAHFQTVDPTVTVGQTVTVGTPLGLMGTTGRSGACHTHFAISPGTCPVDAWWIRRGVIWPSKYLDAWRAGENLSPLDEVNAWMAAHPTACTDQAASGFPVG